MKKLRLIFVALIAGCVLFLLSPMSKTYAYFTDTKIIPINLKLKMMPDITGSATPATLYFNGGKDKEVSTKLILKTVTDEKITSNPIHYEVSSVTYGQAPDPSILVDGSNKHYPKMDYKNYFEISSPSPNKFGNADGTPTSETSTDITLKKIKDFDSNLIDKNSQNRPITITIKVTVFDQKPPIYVSFNIQDRSNDYDWPNDSTFTEKYFFTQDLIYSKYNDKLFTVTPAIMYVKGEKKENENGNAYKLEDATFSIKSPFFYQDVILEKTVKYIENKGYKVTFSIPKDTPSCELGESIIPPRLNILKQEELKSKSSVLQLALSSDYSYSSPNPISLEVNNSKSLSLQTKKPLPDLSSFVEWKIVGVNSNSVRLTPTEDWKIIRIEQLSKFDYTNPPHLRLVSKKDPNVILLDRKINGNPWWNFSNTNRSTMSNSDNLIKKATTPNSTEQASLSEQATTTSTTESISTVQSAEKIKTTTSTTTTSSVSSSTEETH